MLVFPYIFGRHIPKMVRQIFNKGKLNNKFKQIFDHLDETILIINKENYSISYVNNFFYQQFKDTLLKLQDDEISEC